MHLKIGKDGGNGVSGLEVNGVVEEDMFVLEDSDDEAEDSDMRRTPNAPPADAPPPYLPVDPPPIDEGLIKAPAHDADPTGSALEPGGTVEPLPVVANGNEIGGASSRSSIPLRHYITPGDTLSGLSLKYGVDARRLARMNKLPPSTLSTTPHLLHTRQYLDLPPSSRVPSSSTTPPFGAEQVRVRERAEKRFAFVTKEVDYRIAKAYVALAEGDLELDGGVKKVEGKPAVEIGAEGLAVDSYLDDTEWEEAERRAGRKPQVLGFPYFKADATRNPSSSGRWWRSSGTLKA